MTENYTVTLEITPELEERAKVWASDEGGYTPELAAVGKAILDATPKQPDLLKQAFAIVCPSSNVDQWPGPRMRPAAVSPWLAIPGRGACCGECEDGKGVVLGPDMRTPCSTLLAFPILGG